MFKRHVKNENFVMLFRIATFLFYTCFPPISFLSKVGKTTNFPKFRWYTTKGESCLYSKIHFHESFDQCFEN